MLTKFFIDRPIFATVLSVLITLTGVIALRFLPLAQYPRITPPSVNVAITYPGASAQIVADTVAAPIEQEVTGVPGMFYMASQMGNDGSYSLSVTFDVGVDLNTALVMVQNRVALAMPKLPSQVQNQGITIRKKTPDTLCMVNFISAVKVETTDGKIYTGMVQIDRSENGDTLTLLDADKKLIQIPKADIKKNKPIYSDIYLSNFALINVKDELLRVDGVSDISIMGERDYSVRIWLDPQKLASRNMTALDVAAAVQSQNIEVAPGQVGKPPVASGQSLQLPLDTLGRLADPKQFEDIILKVGQGLPRKSSSQAMAPSPGGGSGDATMSGSTGAAAMTISNLVSGGTLTGGANTGGGGTTGGGANAGGGGTVSGGTNTTGGGANTGGGATVGGGASLNSMPTAAKKKSPTSLVSAGAAGNQGPASTSVGIVRLKDVCTKVEMGALNYNLNCTFDGGPAVGLNMYQLPGTNALDVAVAVRAKMKELQARFPEGLEWTIAYDTAPYIRESIGEVFYTLRDAIILVAIVVLFFLQDWRAMILPMIDIPVSLIGTFAVMAVMGYSLNNVSLFGLVLAIGIVVDDAIVVLENIERQMAKGHDTRTATIKAMEEISGPILAITLVLCAVFVPCAFITGITGRFFKQFAVIIAASTIISAINALTMTPSRALVIFKNREGHAAHTHKPEALPWWIFGLMGWITSRWGAEFLQTLANFELPIEDDEASFFSLKSVIFFIPGLLIGLPIGWFIIKPVNVALGAFFRGFNRCFDLLTSVYGWTIGMSLRLSVIVLLAYGALVCLTYYMFDTAPTGFVPQQDMGRVIVSVQLPDSAGLERTMEEMAKVEKVILRTPGVAHSIGLCGISFVEQANAANFGSFFVILDPFDKRQKRELRAEAIMAKFRRDWAKEIKDCKVVVLGSSPIPGLSVAGGFRLMVQDRGDLGLLTLQEQTGLLIRKIRQQIGEDAGTQKKSADGATESAVQRRPLLTNVATQFRSNTPQLFLDIDSVKAASLNVPLDDVRQTLEIYLGSLYVNSFNEYGRHWQVTLQADLNFRSTVPEINLAQVRNNSGQMVPFGTLVRVKEISGPIFVKRYNLYTAAPVTGALLPGVSSGDVIKAVDQVSDEALPLTMKAEWTELMFMQIREGSTTGIVFALAVMCVFLALSALYESWTLPLAVILVVPLCVLCSLIGTRLTNNSLNIFVQIGLVVLVGLACKNAILVVEFARELHQQGRSVFDATLESSKLRLRPILMTSFAFILGVVPLCIASGAGAEMRKSLGTAVFSGMVGVTAFGIFLTPVFFYVIQGVGETKLFSNLIVKWVGSGLAAGALGAATGYLLIELGALGHFPPVMAMLLGAGAGILIALSVRGIHRKIKTR